MDWWSKLFGRSPEPAVSAPSAAPDFSLQGWTLEEDTAESRCWRDASGSVLGWNRALASPEETDPVSEATWRDMARTISSNGGGGLVEARIGSSTPQVRSMIYKALHGSGYVFTGLLSVPSRSEVWSVVAGELGTTGIREAVVTAELLKSGKLTAASYDEFARDPYDPDFRGADRSLLRFLSDDEAYDARFPEHPLTRVRATFAWLESTLQQE